MLLTFQCLPLPLLSCAMPTRRGLSRNTFNRLIKLEQYKVSPEERRHGIRTILNSARFQILQQRPPPERKQLRDVYYNRSMLDELNRLLVHWTAALSVCRKYHLIMSQHQVECMEDADRHIYNEAFAFEIQKKDA